MWNSTLLGGPAVTSQAILVNTGITKGVLSQLEMAMLHLRTKKYKAVINYVS